MHQNLCGLPNWYIFMIQLVRKIVYFILLYCHLDDLYVWITYGYNILSNSIGLIKNTSQWDILSWENSMLHFLFRLNFKVVLYWKHNIVQNYIYCVGIEDDCVFGDDNRVHELPINTIYEWRKTERRRDMIFNVTKLFLLRAYRL